MSSADQNTADGNIRPANLGAEARRSPVAIDRCNSRCVVVNAVVKAVAVILEIRKQSVRVEVGSFRKLVIQAPGQTPTAAVVTVFPHVRSVKKALGPSTGKSGDVWRGLHVVNAATCPIVAAADQRSEALLAAESLANGASCFNLPAPSQDWHKSAHAAEVNRGLIGGRFRYEVNGAADSVSIHIWQKSFVDFN